MRSSSSAATSVLLLIMTSPSAIASVSDHDHSQKDNPHVDLCSNDDQCLNGGSCQEGNSVIPHRHCLCASGFSGPACQRFCPLDCQNGGYCHVAPTGGATGLLIDQGKVYDPEDYTCKCFGYFTGALCEIPYKRCGDSERCYNGSKCVAGEDMRHHCHCKPGYTGDSCETKSSIVILKESSNNTALEGILVTMVILLSVALVYILKRKRTKLTPDFVQVQRSALEHKMAAMPHASFDDELSIIEFSKRPRRNLESLFEEDETEKFTRGRVGPFNDDESSAASSDSSRFGGIHII